MIKQYRIFKAFCNRIKFGLKRPEYGKHWRFLFSEYEYYHWYPDER